MRTAVGLATGRTARSTVGCCPPRTQTASTRCGTPQSDYVKPHARLETDRAHGDAAVMMRLIAWPALRSQPAVTHSTSRRLRTSRRRCPTFSRRVPDCGSRAGRDTKREVRGGGRAAAQTARRPPFRVAKGAATRAVHGVAKRAAKSGAQTPVVRCSTSGLRWHRRLSSGTCSPAP